MTPKDRRNTPRRTDVPRSNRVDITGQRFGKWTVLHQTPGRAKGCTFWNCVCDCGTEGIRQSWAIRSGTSKSCGCLRLDLPPKDKRKDLPLWHSHMSAKYRAKTKGIAFDIELEDLDPSTHCPLLCIPIVYVQGRGVGNPDSPSIDRIDPTKGYTKDNVWVISSRANSLKNNATLKELQMLVRNLRKRVLSESSRDGGQALLETGGSGAGSGT